ncbi:DHCR7 [Symbiodinium natans]|uniref:DHCR7 protein n=1 Tax=Symbiodinium natans TaxID=878477 RepID=A0A812PGW6_9DINO|nr:DHCR7 [Symbiodinium natans]
MWPLLGPRPAMACRSRRAALLAVTFCVLWLGLLPHGSQSTAFASPAKGKKQQVSMFDMATTARKTKSKTSKPKSKAKGTKARAEKKVKPFPSKAGDSFLPAQGACVAGAFLPVQYPTEQLDIEKILFSPDSSFKIGLGITIVGFLIGLVSIVTVTAAMEDKNGRLATSGPFAVIRSPTYTGFIIMCAGACVMANFSPVRAFFTVALAVVLALKLAEEEEALLEARPEEWTRYTKKVPFKLVPFLW